MSEAVSVSVSEAVSEAVSGEPWLQLVGWSVTLAV